METETPAYLWFLIPVLFVTCFSLLWLGVTGMLGAMSGWYRLQKAFPDRPEPPLAQLRAVNAMMGGAVPVNFRFCLRLDVCPTGLRIGVTRLLGPFQRPFFVPWSEITVERGKLLFSMCYRLRLGHPVISTLTLYGTTAQKLAATGHLRLPDEQPAGVPGR